MCLDDGTADREPNAHTVVLGTVERFEEAISGIGSEADAGILHDKPNVPATIFFRLNLQLPWSIFNFPHCVYGIAKQIDDHLLKLYAVAVDRRKILSEVRLQKHPAPAQLTRRERNDLACCVIQIDAFGDRFLPLEERSQARDDIGGSISVANGAQGRLARPFDIRRLLIQHLQARFRIGNNAREWLVYFMSNGSC